MTDWLRRLKDWWWLLGVVVGVIVVWGNLPQRVTASEQKISDLQAWAQETQGYTKALQEQNALARQQQAAPLPWTFLREDGDYQVFRDPAGVAYCCDGTVCQLLVGKRCGR